MGFAEASAVCAGILHSITEDALDALWEFEERPQGFLDNYAVEVAALGFCCCCALYGFIFSIHGTEPFF
ncbi:hypothetical protein Cyrtocomes_00613 [Candidatus Cyrtobacter comes]|uniref:Uncharacterized protein n=1 Tax=Candidatus Cyrtobacter comes TaxID=675776 RepID=A0ABU5L7Z7_9RICK|nr:hypothetical protein [Candidatus Cyrtobacter comes]MDZ5762238.1 hypothetical protein [Candidatus Cyrtobacter comes]